MVNVITPLLYERRVDTFISYAFLCLCYSLYACTKMRIGSGPYSVFSSLLPHTVNMLPLLYSNRYSLLKYVSSCIFNRVASNTLLYGIDCIPYHDEGKILPPWVRRPEVIIYE